MQKSALYFVVCATINHNMYCMSSSFKLKSNLLIKQRMAPKRAGGEAVNTGFISLSINSGIA